jgi:hypothetical protein
MALRGSSPQLNQQERLTEFPLNSQTRVPQTNASTCRVLLSQKDELTGN